MKKEDPSEKLEYSRLADNTILLTVKKKGKEYHPTITLTATTDDEYFSLKKQTAENAKTVRDLSFELLMPFANLANEKKSATAGFKSSPQTKELISAMQGYLHCEALIETTNADDDELLDYEDTTPVSVFFLFNGKEIRKLISFREILQTEMDEFLSANLNKPNKTVLASHAHKTTEERVFELGKKLVAGSEYPENDIPAWHLINATSVYCNSEYERLGKF